ncbi:hypothetical protein LSH36_162g08045 [Paralvinella palmiformis]|uniref:PDZ domain-containing protein n=1 Tax=Paralvinella palmiformis TaxID=53620 RepID=A0AAD9JU14_9ANNE|nr:hypothetical protein LSH36_162g08045 [Paralvinella palmiformis]
MQKYHLGGLGFNIKGGKDAPYLEEDDGIFVTKIRPEGTAAEDGRLKEGDKIMEINGYSLLNVTHNEAVNLFRNSGNVVNLKVIPGVEDKIKAEKALREKANSSHLPKYWKSIAITVAIGALSATLIFTYLNRGKNVGSFIKSWK